VAQPYDYTIQQPDILGSIVGGLQAGQQIASSQNAQDKAAMYQADLQNYLQNPTARGASAMIAKYPESQKALSASFDIYDKGQKEDIFKSGTQAYSAIKNGKPEIAIGILDQRIQAAANSGEDTSDLESLKQSIQQNPQGAAAGLALTMSSMNPDAWSKIASEQREAELAPSQLSESQAKAQKAGVDAKFAESKAVQDLSKGGWEIQKLANDIGISRQNAQIAAINAATAREGNSLKKEELQLKLDEKIQKRDDAVREKVAKIESVRSTIDNSVGTIDRILKNPALNSVLGAVEGSSLYPSTLVGLLPGTASADDRANAEADIDTLKSQTFLNKLQEMKEASTTGASGLGGLTEKEGEKLVNGVQSLRTKQSEKQFRENLTEVQRLLMKNRANLANKYGVPDTIPDTPQAQPSPDDIDALVRQYGGGQ
jgi:hypothetical protein